MNKEDSIKENFKQALQSTYKVISDDYKAVKNKKNDEKVYDIGEIDNINDKNQFKKLRAETDSEALKRRFSNRKLKKNDLRLDSLDGMKFNLLKDEWKVSKDKSINYIGRFIKN